MKIYLIAAAAAATVASPAFAQTDEGSFQGAHVEGVVGYDKLDVNTPGTKNPDGVVYGVAGGYDLQTGNVVYGIEGEATDSSAKIRQPGFAADAERDLYVGGRIGYASGKALIYGKVGYTNARIDSNLGATNGDGLRVGAGVEYKLGGNLFAKGEYRYSNYEGGVSRNQVVGGIGFRF